MDQHLDFQKKLEKYCGFIFKWKHPIIKTAVSCKLSPLHLPIASFLCKTVNLKAICFFFSSFFFFQLCRSLFNVPMKLSKCLSVCQSREEHTASNPIENCYGLQPGKSHVSKTEWTSPTSFCPSHFSSCFSFLNILFSICFNFKIALLRFQ